MILNNPFFLFNRKIYFWYIFFVFFIIINTPLTLFAQKRSLEYRLIERNKEIASSIDTLATQLDLFLSNRRVSTVELENKTSLHLIYFNEVREQHNSKNTFDVRLKLNLPNLEEKIKVSFTSYNDEDEIESLSNSRRNTDLKDKKYGANVSFYKNLGRIKVSVQPRIEFKDPINTAFYLKFEHSKENKATIIRSNLKLFAHSADGTGQSLGIDFGIKLNRKWILYLVNEEKYLDIPRLLSTYHEPSLNYRHSSKTNFSAGVSYFLNDSIIYRLEEYRYFFTIKRELYKRILYLNLTPDYKCARVNRFSPQFGFRSGLEFIF